MTRKDPAQWEIVLRELRNAGPRGVHTFELRRMFIGNPSQRIAELEQKGYRITSTREKLHGRAVGSRYVLQDAPVAVEQVREDVRLCSEAALRPAPRNAIFDDPEDWAA